MSMDQSTQIEITRRAASLEQEREGVLIWESSSLEHFGIHGEGGRRGAVFRSGEGSDDGVPGEEVGLFHLGEDERGEGEVRGRGEGDSGVEDAAGDEGVAEEAGDYGVGEDGLELGRGVAGLEGKEAGMALNYLVGGDPGRGLVAGGGREAGSGDGGSGAEENDPILGRYRASQHALVWVGA